MEHLAAQHGKLLAHLHQELEDLKEDVVRWQFGEEIVAWVDVAQSETRR